MIPRGYAQSLHAWATRPDLSDEEKENRKSALLQEHDRLVTGQLGGKASRSLAGGSMNGKDFTWQVDMSAAEKLTVITETLSLMGLLSAESQPATVTHATFGNLER